MANEQNKPSAAQQQRSGRYDIKNPTRARRIIYDGIPDQQGGMRSITIESGGTVKNVALSSDIVKEMQERNKAQPNSDLIITSSDGASKDDAS